MATTSRVTPIGWEQGDDASTSSRVTPNGWNQIAAAGGGGTPVGTSTETDTALGLSGVHIAATGRADETDAALALSAVRIAAAGLASETDTALALGAVHAQVVGLATETDEALALGGAAGTQPGIATETDTALALGAVRIAPVGLAVETDTALDPGFSVEVVAISLGGRRRYRRDWRSFDVMPHWTPPDADGQMSDGEPVQPKPDAASPKVRSALSAGLEGSIDALAPPVQRATEPAAAVNLPQDLAPGPEPAPQQLQPKTLTIADILTRDDLTHEELLQAVKLLARQVQGGTAARVVRSHRIALRR